MKNIAKIYLVLILVFIICGIAFLIGFSSESSEPGNNNQTKTIPEINNLFIKDELPRITRTTGPVLIDALIFKNSSSLPGYRGKSGENDSLNLRIKQIVKERKNVTTSEEASEAARKALEPYGGLPPDAVYMGASITYSEIYNHTLKKTTYKEPMFISAGYTQDTNGLPVVGDSNRIIVTLGTDGELLWLFKVWRNYTYTGDVPIITVDEAIDKLNRGEVIATTWYPALGNVTIDTITPGYYPYDIGNSEVILEPVWLMSGTGDADFRFEFYIYARKFAAFSTTPAIASPNEEITFRDTSDASPMRRFWEFGDGTNSTLRNPEHTYEKTGNYTVNLTVWNDLGSDRISKTIVITRDQIKTGNPYLGNSDHVKAGSVEGT